MHDALLPCMKIGMRCFVTGVMTMAGVFHREALVG